MNKMTSLGRRLAAIAITVGFAAATISPAWADPPPWAPAHGYRAKHGHGHHRDDDYRYRDGRGHDYGNLFVPRGSVFQCNRDVIGAILGGAAGGIAGSNIGEGKGRIAATIGGTILGLLGGHAIGESIDRTDSACTGYALDRLPDGHTARWVNPDSNQSFDVTPVRSWRSENNQYCREYTVDTTIAGRPQQISGTACLQPDGSWKIKS